jgi:putative transposase
MQISRSVHSEISQEGDLRRTSQRVGSDSSGFGTAERGRGGGGTPDERPCAHAVVDTTEVLVSRVVGFIKGKSAITIARRYMGQAKNLVGQDFWARGYYVSTVGRDEAEVRRYIQAQEKEDRRLDQLKIFE